MSSLARAGACGLKKKKRPPTEVGQPINLKSSEGGRAARRQRRRGSRRYMGRCSSLQGMGERRRLSKLHCARRRWQSHWQAQGAVHCSVAGYSAVVAVHGHQFEHAAAGTHQFGGLGRHQRRRHRHTQRQSKPHQHEAGEVAQLSEGLHGEKYSRLVFQPKSAGRLAFNAATPSRTSGPAKPMNSSASEVSNAGPAWRSQLFKEYLVQRMALWLPLANLSATS